MKQLIVFGYAVGAIFLGAAQVRANDISLVQTNLSTDYTVAGVGGMRDVGSGIIVLTGVRGIVTQAYLYWHGPMNSVDPTANAAVFIDGQPIRGTNIGFSAPNCWPNLILSQAYRAEVTDIVAANAASSAISALSQASSEPTRFAGRVDNFTSTSLKPKST